jgi:hypothetical protein
MVVAPAAFVAISDILAMAAKDAGVTTLAVGVRISEQ